MWEELTAVLRGAVRGWSEDRAASMGAAIAYYTVFSLAPILLLVIAIAGMAFGEQAAQGALFGTLREIIGAEGARALEALIRNAAIGGAGPIAATVGGVTLLIAATAVLAELQSALNVIWKAQPVPGIHPWLLLKRRLLCLAIIIAGGALLTLTLAASTAIEVFSSYLRDVGLSVPLILHAGNTVLGVIMTMVLFGAICRILPDTYVSWSDVWLGSAVASVLFTIGKYLISLYIGSKEVTSIYGAAGALVIVLIWVYYSTQILLFGAEITKAHADWRKVRERGAAPLSSAPPRST